MNFVKRAWFRLISSVGKTLILAGVVAAIGTLVLSGFLIQSAAGKAADAAKEQVGASAKMKLDINAWAAKEKIDTSKTGAGGLQVSDSANLMTGIVDKIGEAGIATSYNYELETLGTPIDGTNLYQAVPPPAGQGTNGVNGALQVHGVRDSAMLPRFADGTWTLLSGDPITADSAATDALIEERFAKDNGLKVGDKFTLEGNIGGTPTGQKVEFTVKGIYRDPAESNKQQFTPPYFEPGNGVYLTAAGASSLDGVKPGAAGSKISEATFTLKNPDDLAALLAAAKDAGVDVDVFPISVNDKLYKTLVGPITSTASFAKTTVWLVSIAGGLILGLIVTAMIRERRREYGVLMSMGESRGKLIGQSLVEVGACALIGLAVAVPMAAGIAEFAGQFLLGNEISSAAEATAGQPDLSSVNGAANPDAPKPIDRLNVAVTTSDITKVALTGLVIATIATLIPAAQILRLKPRTILTKGD